MVQHFAEAAVSISGWNPMMSKSIFLACALSAAAIGLGLVGFSYMKALGRNPEAGKAAGQVVIIAAMIEVTALLSFLLGAFLLK